MFPYQILYVISNTVNEYKLTSSTGVVLVTPVTIITVQVYQTVSSVSKEGRFGYSVLQIPTCGSMQI